MNSKKVKWLAFCLSLALIGSLLVYFISIVSFSQTFIPGEAGECISIAFFEKQKMRTVDKVVLRVDEKVVTISDANLIHEIVKETTLATHTGLKFSSQGYIDLYSGDTLLRSMEWEVEKDTVKVYKPARTHWIIVPFANWDQRKNEGLVFLSASLADKLIALLRAA